MKAAGLNQVIRSGGSILHTCAAVGKDRVVQLKLGLSKLVSEKVLFVLVSVPSLETVIALELKETNVLPAISLPEQALSTVLEDPPMETAFVLPEKVLFVMASALLFWMVNVATLKSEEHEALLSVKV